MEQSPFYSFPFTPDVSDVDKPFTRADMASTSSRQAALERRKALTEGGKKSAGRYNSAPGRVRTAADALPARTVTPPSAPPAAAPMSAVVTPTRSRPSAAALGSPSPERRSVARPLANPSRDLVLARREALSRRGKRADASKDRTRTDLAHAAPAPAATKDPEHKCKCQDKGDTASATSRSSRASLPSLSAPSRTSTPSAGAERRAATAKRAAVHNPSRALVLARREALSKRGKSANTSNSSSAASVARQGNPDMSSRELAQKLRELKCKLGSAGSSRSGGTQRRLPWSDLRAQQQRHAA